MSSRENELFSSERQISGNDRTANQSLGFTFASLIASFLVYTILRVSTPEVGPDLAGLGFYAATYPWWVKLSVLVLLLIWAIIPLVSIGLAIKALVHIRNSDHPTRVGLMSAMSVVLSLALWLPIVRLTMELISRSVFRTS